MHQHPLGSVGSATLILLLSAARLCGQVSGMPPASAAGDAPVTVGDVRYASGTSWQPDETPVRALHGTAAGWRFMLHGSASLAYVKAQTRRGGARLGSANWGMVHASRSLPRGMLTLTGAGSLETITLGKCGLPGLLAAGPACLVATREFQHPHPPLMELSGRLEQRISGPLRLELYGALAGEPALGPPTYLHRLSATADPIAPISHHETSPAHASGGVLTAGAGSARWKLEGSVFHGAASDPDRLLPELGPLTSRAGRLSLNPSPAWSMQLSLGRIVGAPGHHSGADGTIRSMTASAMHHRRMGGRDVWATSLALARTEDGTLPRRTALLESSLSRGDTHTWFGRIEAADRVETRITIIEQPDGSHEHRVDSRRLQVAQVAAGYLLGRRIRAASVGAGVRGSISFLPAELRAGDRVRRPVSFAVYGSVRPAFSAEHHHE
ncbi:MAG TPA: hypothetical protein VHG28_05785 [Longimicrobiaceae bacterium]|nr:hypothetical protein [Longimicrobiaceae bacterium]